MNNMENKKMWHCEIGEVDCDKIPMGGDSPMRDAVAKAFKDLTREDSIFIFSGWGNKLSEGRRAVVENRAPNRDKVYSEILADISTDDLIAELERRRPCEKCGNKEDVKYSDDHGCSCVFKYMVDNFKEATKGRKL